LAINLSHRHLTRFHEAKSHYTDRATAFVNEVRSHVPARERLIVIVRGKHPLPTLLGLHQGSYLTRKSFVGPVFVVMPEQKDLSAVVMSAPLPIGFDDIEDRAVSRVGLYYFAAGDVPVDRLVALQKQVGAWTRTENPYHAPGTVYRE